VSYFNQISLPSSNIGAFGDLETVTFTPLVQWSFATGLRDQLLTTSVNTTGVADSLTGRLRLQSGTGVAGSATAQSVRPGSYRPGQGVTFRGTPTFATAGTGSNQFFGAGNSVDGYFFGYNGATFGILYRASSADTWIPASTWNGDKCDGTGGSAFTWDTTKGVPTMIKYPYLGHGNVTFWVQNPVTSLWILCHTIKYADSSALPQISNPCLSLYGQVINTGTATNRIMYVTCAAMFLDGAREYLGGQFSVDTTHAALTTNANIISIRSCTTINGALHRGSMRLRSVAFANAVSGVNPNSIVTFRLVKGATVGGSPSFTPQQGSTADNGVTLTAAQSAASYDVAGTTISGGSQYFSLVLPANAGEVVDLTPFNMSLSPGETWTISASASNSAVPAVAVSWQEEVE
jgi:hypothetical protein